MSFDAGLARTCEVHERQAWQECVEACEAVAGNPLSAEVAWVGEVPVPVVARLDFALFNRVIGLGVDAPVAAGAVPAIRSVYEARRQQHWTVSVSPLAMEAELAEALVADGLIHAGDMAKVIRPAENPPTAETQLRIELVGSDFADRFASVAVAAFGAPEGFSAWFSGTVGRPGWRHYIGFDDREAVSTGALYVEGQLGWLGFGATLPSHRNRGGQSAMMARRIRDAASLGCTFVHTETGAETASNPNPSYRNMIRCGFHHVYNRADYTPSREAQPS